MIPVRLLTLFNEVEEGTKKVLIRIFPKIHHQSIPFARKIVGQFNMES